WAPAVVHIYQLRRWGNGGGRGFLGRRVSGSQGRRVQGSKGLKAVRLLFDPSTLRAPASFPPSSGGTRGVRTSAARRRSAARSPGPPGEGHAPSATPARPPSAL